jgi:drug/metabolite transporter (DMT)-like permease
LNQRILAYLALFLGVLALAFSPIFVSLAQVNGLAATLYRTSIAASALLIPFLLPRNNHLGTATTRPSLRTAIAIAGLGGLLFALNNGLFNTAVTLIPASSAVFLANTAVIWVGLFSIVIFHEKLSLNFWVGVFLALTGVYLITTGRGGVSSDNFLLGSFVALLGGFFYGLYILFNNTARRFLNALAYMVLSNFSSGLMIFVAILVVGVPYRGFSLATYGYLFGLGFVSQAIGFLVIVYAQAYLPPSRVSTILLAQPLLVLVLASIILREQPSTLQLVGMFTLFGGIVLANRR